MLDLDFRDRYARAWCQREGSLAAGYAFQEGRFLDAGDLAGLAAQGLGAVDTAHSLLAALDGCFALVVARGDALLAAVDRTRSIPLFFASEDNRLVVGDDPFRILGALRSARVCPVSRAEFFLSGVVSGNDTYYMGVRQLQAGQLLRAARQAGGSPWNITVESYYDYLSTDAPIWENDHDALRERLEVTLRGAARRLIESARGRTLAVSLSGGYDSRCILRMLHEARYEPVVCFTYGRENSAEVRVARAVAESLGKPWVFLPYSAETWKEAFASAAFSEFLMWASHASALPHVTDFPAAENLRARRMIPDDAIVVPGHTALGSAYEAALLPRRPHEDWNRTLLEYLLRVHCRWQRPRDLPTTEWSAVQEKFEGILGTAAIESRERAADLFEWFAWRNEKTKYIANAIRAYEFFGYPCRLPLYDVEFMDFWSHCPREQVRGKVLFNKMVERWSAEHRLPTKPDLPASGANRLAARCLEAIGRNGPIRVVLNALRSRSDPARMYEIVPPRERAKYQSYLRPYMTYMIRDLQQRLERWGDS